MRIAWGWFSILLRSWQSKADLGEFIGRSSGGLLIGESTEEEKEFYSATVIKELANEAEPLAIGICSEGHGVTPQLLTVPALRLCLFGVNCEVVAVDVEARHVAYSIDLGYSFRNMIHIPGKNLILAFHETGACAFREDGAVVWNFSKDVLEMAHLNDAKIYFEFMDSEPVMVDLTSGKETASVHRNNLTN